MKKLLTFCVAVGFVFAISGMAQAADINVPSDYTTIQGAIDAANDGDTINVAAETYNETIVVRYFADDANRLTIQSTAGAATTIIDCGGATNGVQIVSNDITFSGFTVQNAYNLISQVSGNDHVLSDLMLTDFVNYGMSVLAAHDCTFSDITIHTNDGGNSNDRTVKGIDIQEYGSGGNTNNHFEDIIIHDIETTGPSGTSMGIYLEGDNPDTHPTTGNTFTNVDIYDLASEYLNCGVYILDTGYYTGTGHMNPYAIEDTTFSGGSIYGFTENDASVDSLGFYVKGGNKNLDITCFDITGCDDGVYFKSFAGTTPPTFPPTGWIRIDNNADGHVWVWDGSNANTGSACASMDCGSVAPNDYLVTPQQMSIQTDDKIEFYAKTTSLMGGLNFDLMVSTTDTSPASFATVATNATTTSWSKFSYDLSAYNGDNIYIAIHANTYAYVPGWGLLIDDVTLPYGTTEGFEGATTTVGAVDVTVNFNDIYGNTIYGVDNNNGVGTIDAKNNWWGDVSGPYDPLDDDGLNQYNPGGLGDPVSEYVLYEPWLGQGGFVTGGGTIWSSAGYYIWNPTAEGEANFGFVAKYKKGANTPDGHTNFVFEAGGLHFRSSEYDWLVAAGDTARFKGTGTIEWYGSGYKFLLWAGDGEPDTFRIKIWEEVDGFEDVVYDNGSQQAITGGNIFIHKDKGKK